MVHVNMNCYSYMMDNVIDANLIKVNKKELYFMVINDKRQCLKLYANIFHYSPSEIFETEFFKQEI